MLLDSSEVRCSQFSSVSINEFEGRVDQQSDTLINFLSWLEFSQRIFKFFEVVFLVLMELLRVHLVEVAPITCPFFLV